MYINLIGVDGAGKDIQISLLKEKYPTAEFVFEPGGTKESDIIRKVLLEKDLTDVQRIDSIKEVIQTQNIEPYTVDCLIHAMNIIAFEGLSGRAEMLLYAASRCENIEKRIKPNLTKNIIGSRSIACSMSYQGKARGIGYENVWAINAPALDNTYPDLEIFLDLPIEVARERLKNRTNKVERFDEEDAKFFETVRNGYLEYYEMHCPYEYVLLDANQTIECVHNAIVEILVSKGF